MKAAVVTIAGEIKVQEVPDPIPDAYEALVEVIACGFCNSTDIKIIEGHWPGLDPLPYILGHEGVGRVVKPGAKARNLKPGNLVLIPGVGSYPELGIGSAWGGFVEKALVSDWKAMQEDKIGLSNPFSRAQQVVPPEMDPMDAVMLITLKEVYSALQGFGFRPGMDVLIFGDGPVGICMVVCARQMGGREIILSGHHEERLQLGKEMGATHVVNARQGDLKRIVAEIAPGGLSLIIDAVGSNEAVQQGLDLIADEGHIGVYGYTDQRMATFDWSRAPVRWSIDYLVVPNLDRLVLAHQVLVDLIMSGKINLKALVTHKLPLEEIQRAYSLVKGRQAVKVIVEMGM